MALPSPRFAVASRERCPADRNFRAGDELFSALAAIAATQGVRALRLLHAPLRGSGRVAAVPPCLTALPHGPAKLAAAVASHLVDNAQLEALEVGFTLPQSALRCLARSLGDSPGLRTVSFAGAPLGDAGLARLAEGLAVAPRVEALCVASCGLTDAGGATLAALIREHAHQRDAGAWKDTLRAWPEGAGGGHGGGGRRDASRGTSAAAVAGLIHLDASFNELGLATAIALAGCLEPGRHATRLTRLELVGCALPVEAGDWIADVMRRGASLQLADLRRNGDSGLAVVLRSRDGRVDHVLGRPADAAASPPPPPHSRAVQQPSRRPAAAQRFDPEVAVFARPSSAAGTARRFFARPSFVAPRRSITVGGFDDPYPDEEAGVDQYASGQQRNGSSSVVVDQPPMRAGVAPLPRRPLRVDLSSYSHGLPLHAGRSRGASGENGGRGGGGGAAWRAHSGGGGDGRPQTAAGGRRRGGAGRAAGAARQRRGSSFGGGGGGGGFDGPPMGKDSLRALTEELTSALVALEAALAKPENGGGGGGGGDGDDEFADWGGYDEPPPPQQQSQPRAWQAQAAQAAGRPRATSIASEFGFVEGRTGRSGDDGLDDDNGFDDGGDGGQYAYGGESGGHAGGGGGSGSGSDSWDDDNGGGGARAYGPTSSFTRAGGGGGGAWSEQEEAGGGREGGDGGGEYGYDRYDDSGGAAEGRPPDMDLVASIVAQLREMTGMREPLRGVQEEQYDEQGEEYEE